MKSIADITCIVYPNEVMVANDTSSDTMTVDDFYSSTKFMVISKKIILRKKTCNFLIYIAIKQKARGIKYYYETLRM